MHRCVWRVMLAVGCLLYVIQTRPVRAMPLPGAADPTDLSVTRNTGASTITVPIPVPPGTGGFAPSMSLAYSSLGGDGPFGAGWRLEFGDIQRSFRFGVPAYDDAVDRFELRGELLVVNPEEGTDAATRYHTLTETFSRIVHHTSSGADYWEVTRTDGTRIRYGLDDSARVRRDGGSGPVFRWLLSEMEDASGNVIQFTHIIENGAAYPDTARYTLRGEPRQPVGTQREVRFVYEPRPDPSMTFMGGVRRRIDRRASAIEVRVGERVFRRIELGYSDAPGALKAYSTGRSRLDSMQLVGVDGLERLPAERFEYRDASDVLGPASNTSSHWQAASFSLPVPAAQPDGTDLGVRVADVNGDGHADVVRAYQPAGGSPTHEVYLGTGDGWQAAPDPTWSSALAGIQALTHEEVVTTDRLLGPFSQPDIGFFIEPYYEGVPVACFPSDRVFRNERMGPVLFADGEQRPALSFLQQNSRTTHTLPPQWRLVDVNGDGRADLVRSTQGAARVISFTCEHADPSPTNVAPGYRSAAIRQIGPTYGEVWINTGSGWQRDPALSDSLPPFAGMSVKGAVKLYDHDPRFEDLNADGRVDLVVMDKGNFTIGDAHIYTSRAYLNTSDGWVRAPELDPPANHRLLDGDAPDTPFLYVDEDRGVRFVDVNRDGMGDFLESSSGGMQPGTSALLNNGFGFCDEAAGCEADKYLPPEPLASDGSGLRFDFTDVNGDGFVDLVKRDPGAATRTWLHDPGDTTSVWRQDARFAAPSTARAGLIDANSDDAPDLVSLTGGSSQRGRARFGDLLAVKTNSMGGVTEYGYESAAKQQVPFVNLAADTILDEAGGADGVVRWSTRAVLVNRRTSGVGVVPSTQEFAYAQPRFLLDQRASQGFAFVRTNIPGQVGQHVYFAQRHGISGRVLQRRVFSLTQDSGERERVVNTYEVLTGDDPAVGAGSTAAALVGRLTSTSTQRRYGLGVFAGGPGELPGATQRTTFEYDAKNGDAFAGYNFVTRTTQSRITGTRVTTRTMAAPDTSAWIVGLPEQVLVESGARELAKTRFVYDRGLVTDKTVFDGPRGDLSTATPRTETRSFDAFGNAVSVTDAAGRTTEFCYDGSAGFPSGVACNPPTDEATFSAMVAVRDPLGQVTSFMPDPVTGQVTETLRRYSGDRELTRYDGFGRVVEEAFHPAEGEEVVLSTTHHMDLDDSPIGQAYTERFDVVAQDGDTLRSSTYFDGFAREVRQVDEAPRVDGARRYRGVATRIDPTANQTTTTFVGACGADPHCSGLFQRVSSRVVETRDALGRVTRVETPDGIERNLYYRVGRVHPDAPGSDPDASDDLDAVLAVDARGNVEQRVLDGDRLVWLHECTSGPFDPATVDLTMVACGISPTTFYRYEPAGEIAAIFDDQATDYQDPAQATVRRVFDSLGRVTETHSIDRDGPILTRYDAAGNVSEEINARGQSTLFDYDALNRVSEASYERLDGTGSYQVSYDVATRAPARIRQLDSSGALVTQRDFGYDPFGRRVRESVQYRDNPALIAELSPDLLGRTTQVRYPDVNTTVSYQYDGAYLRRVFEPGSAMGCVNEEKDYLSDIQYDELGRETELVGTASEEKAAPVLSLDYDPATYRLMHFGLQTAESPDAETIDLSYNYDPAGFITDVTDGTVISSGGDVSFGVSYTYDRRNRIVSRTRGGQTRYYTYDSVGNLTGKRVEAPGAVNQSYRADRRHQLVESQGVPYGYDDDGNLTQRGMQSFMFDGLDRMAAVNTAGLDDRFEYGLDGLRLAGGGGATPERVFVGDLFEWEPATGEATARIQALGRVIAYKKIEQAELRSGAELVGLAIEDAVDALEMALGLLATVGLAWLLMWLARVGALLALSRRPLSGATVVVVSLVLVLPAPLWADFDTPPGEGTYRRFVWSNPLGSSVHITDETGDVVHQRSFEPFGEVASERSSERTERLFATHIFEQDLRLYYMQARYYDPAAGRFVSTDPVVRNVASPQSINAYSYVENNPINFIDPSGRQRGRRGPPVRFRPPRRFLPPDATPLRTVLAQARRRLRVGEAATGVVKDALEGDSRLGTLDGPLQESLDLRIAAADLAGLGEGVRQAQAEALELRRRFDRGEIDQPFAVLEIRFREVNGILLDVRGFATPVSTPRRPWAVMRRNVDRFVLGVTRIDFLPSLPFPFPDIRLPPPGDFPPLPPPTEGGCAPTALAATPNLGFLLSWLAPIQLALAGLYWRSRRKWRAGSPAVLEGDDE